MSVLRFGLLSIAKRFYDRLMAENPANRYSGGRGVHGEPEPDVVGMERFADLDDQRLSLDELGQAYAALLARGADLYPEATDSSADPQRDPPDAELPPPIIRGRDDTACDIGPRSILEAILFVGHPTGEPLTSERIAALMRGVQPAEIDDLVSVLNKRYEAAGAPYAIESVGAGYQLSLRPQFAPLRDAFYGRIREARLSQTAIDVLAIVAYHPSITAEEIDRIRGKPSGAVVAQLVRRDLLCLIRPAEQKAKPQYRTSQRFLELFGLETLAELPRSQDIEREL